MISIILTAAVSLLNPPNLPEGWAPVPESTFKINGVDTSISGARLDGEKYCGGTDECRQNYVRYRNAIESAFAVAGANDRGVLKWLIHHFTTDGRTDWVKVSEEYGPWYEYQQKQSALRRYTPPRPSRSTTIRCHTYSSRHRAETTCTTYDY